MAQSHNIPVTLASFVSAAVLLISTAPLASATPTPPDTDSDFASASTAVIAPTTFGRPASTISSSSKHIDGTSNLTAQDEKVLAYWTPERLASAVPYKPAAVNSATAQSTGRAAAPTGQEGSTPPALPLKMAEPTKRSEGTIVTQNRTKGTDPLAAPPVTNFPNTNGKLFFGGYDAENAYCSASALNTDTKRVIITAGHCVYDNGEWMKNVVFVPNYDRRNADPDPVGIWTVRVLRTFNSWINDGDFTHDVGMATLNNGGDNDQRIVDAVGGHGMYWNGSSAFDVSIFGYPSNKTNPNGRYTMWACWGTTFRSGGHDSIVCDFGKGSSGGPWLYDFNNTSGLGYVRSVTSTWASSSGQNWGPYFNNDMKSMKDATNGDW